MKLSYGPHIMYMYTQTNAHSTNTLENHLLDLHGCKESKAKLFKGCEKRAWTWPGAYSLSKSVHMSLLLVQLAQMLFQCMQDCARGILFNDRLIYILTLNAR